SAATSSDSSRRIGTGLTWPPMIGASSLGVDSSGQPRQVASSEAFKMHDHISGWRPTSVTERALLLVALLSRRLACWLLDSFRALAALCTMAEARAVVAARAPALPRQPKIGSAAFCFHKRLAVASGSRTGRRPKDSARSKSA